MVFVALLILLFSFLCYFLPAFLFGEAAARTVAACVGLSAGCDCPDNGGVGLRRLCICSGLMPPPMPPNRNPTVTADTPPPVRELCRRCRRR